VKKISIIIPFYNGNKHLVKMKKVLDCNYESLRGIAELEVLFVNDSPWIEVEMQYLDDAEYAIKIIKHSQNAGIHQARVTGISNATGDYIMMLDQDDVIAKDALATLFNKIEETHRDCVIGNGVFQTPNGDKIILDNYGKTILAKDYHSYLAMGNLLSSPGQTLIRKDAIDPFWMEHIMKTNCADDLFLWCLLMKRKNIAYCNKMVYLHINTGENFSLDKLNGLKSDNEVLQFLRLKDGISPTFLNLFELRYKYQMSVNGKSDKEKRAALYPIILNMWKAYGVLLTIANSLVGNKVPKYTDGSMFEY
jgi:glycosyltransferase involved in cell wall biosynthesis